MTDQCPACGDSLIHLVDLPSAGGFEFDLYGCRRCDHREMHCFCVASSVSGTEAVTPEHAAIMMNSEPGQLKQFMKAWQARAIA